MEAWRRVPITTDKNTSYGPPLVNQKYAPLLNPDWQEADRPVYTGLLNNRATLMRTAALRGGGLDLAMPNWANAITAERAGGRLPPLVVISSNRSKWIARGLAALASIVGKPLVPPLANECDLRALNALDKQSISPPIYAPQRVNANRGVYVVVHMAEYRTYQQNLANTGITPVGWQFKRTGGPRRLDLVGFGASRFAAMELCKRLYTLAPPPGGVGAVAPWSRAWLIDDNVIAITAFPGFANIEAAAGVNDAASGFSGGTKAEAQSDNLAWAGREIQGNRNGPQPLKPSTPPGIIQQCALWNVQYLTQNHLNFSPMYVASAEDLSLTNLFDVRNVPYKFYTGNTVRKEAPGYDESTGARNVNAARAMMTGWVADAEGATSPTPPPPAYVQPRNAEDGGIQSSATFVVNRVLPVSGMSASKDDVGVQHAAKCQAVEQLTCGGIKHGFATAALDATFRINGAGSQVVNQRDIP